MRFWRITHYLLAAQCSEFLILLFSGNGVRARSSKSVKSWKHYLTKKRASHSCMQLFFFLFLLFLWKWTAAKLRSLQKRTLSFDRTSAGNSVFHYLSINIFKEISLSVFSCSGLLLVFQEKATKRILLLTLGM